MVEIAKKYTLWVWSSFTLELLLWGCLTVTLWVWSSSRMNLRPYDVRIQTPLTLGTLMWGSIRLAQIKALLQWRLLLELRTFFFRSKEGTLWATSKFFRGRLQLNPFCYASARWDSSVKATSRAQKEHSLREQDDSIGNDYNPAITPTCTLALKTYTRLS